MRQNLAFLEKISKFTLVALLLLAISLREGSLGGISLYSGQSDIKVHVAAFGNEDVRKIFAGFTHWTDKEEGVYTVFKNNEKIGVMLNSSPKSDSIYGYVNATPVLIGIDPDNKIAGIQLLKNHESPDFVESVRKSGLLNSWNGLDIKEAIEKKTDAVSGATYTSTSVINTVKHTLASYANHEGSAEHTTDFMSILKWVAAIILLIISLGMFILPSRLRAFRTYFLIALVFIVGFWLSDFLSVYLLYNTLVNGLSFGTHGLIIIIIGISLLIPLFTGKSYYCFYLCPYGAAQELAGKITRRSIKIPQKVRKYLARLREFLFAILVFLLIIGVSFDLTDIEPFSGFVIETCSLPVLILSISFIVLSVFIPRPWCNYFCPTGAFLEIFRKLK